MILAVNSNSLTKLFFKSTSKDEVGFWGNPFASVGVPWPSAPLRVHQSDWLETEPWALVLEAPIDEKPGLCYYQVFLCWNNAVIGVLGKMFSWGSCLSSILKYLRELRENKREWPQAINVELHGMHLVLGPCMPVCFYLKETPPINLAVNECLKIKWEKVIKEMVRQWKFWALLSSSSNKHGSISCGEGWWGCRSWTDWGWVRSCSPSTRMAVLAPGRAGSPVHLYLPECWSGPMYCAHMLETWFIIKSSWPCCHPK